MAEITKFYREQMPATRFIGKRYTDADRKNGYFYPLWEEWITEGWFRPLTGYFKDWDFDGSEVPIGLYRLKEGEPAEYWIGRFFPANHKVPEGYQSLDLAAGTLGVCWVRAKGLDLYDGAKLCLPRLNEEGAELAADGNGAFWFFERYEFPRSRTPDEDGARTLDYCFYLAP